MITIVDYGMGNLGSILNMFKKIGVASQIVSNLNQIEAASKLLLPGVGAFDAAMQRVNDSGLKRVLDKKALDEKVPVLGICLGMQLLTYGSDEGELPGLGWIPAYTHRFNPEIELPVPHMGWNEVEISNSHRITEGINGLALEGEKPRFYFVHSFQVQVKNEKHSILKTEYGQTFDSAIAHENIIGCQFHPEKSHKFGMHLLKNFAEI
ncbi:imidazole glycerol phosphate synthase subunit HisH [Roseivirga sp. E12]|uniref:imidazole glycerol phosphate synthase subunit HisH n=1 Tax=Roseivirga sp. E12 TaxID=2819237 RepID=UPI001ABC2DBD|nr:imidazole glycerol phosphate synthase subunit HisH [Roseivirga sp. E12]MBO3699758.1 imidazole glycerol phosphate synthase subunit HisH [Roseivirga sp. E12]